MKEQPAKILVVDDVPSNILVLSQALTADYEIHVATSGEKAIEICRSKLPDLVLLDVVMPGVDGYEVCARLKEDPLTRDIPIIFITARNEVEDETKGLEAGAIDFISKPISPPIVKARVRNHILLKRQTDMLRHLTRLDGLTGIANRRNFDEMLEKSWRRCARDGDPMSLIMIDVDHFKLFNDHYGHQGGDDCLRRIAALLAGQVGRSDDLAARFGGEEFACQLPATDEEGALDVARKIMAAVRQAEIVHAASPVASRVTVSLGVATAWPGGESRTTDLLGLADRLLYQAKAAGRDGMKTGVLEGRAGVP